METSDQNSNVPALEALVTEEVIRKVAKSYKLRSRDREKDPLACCPDLRDFLRDESLKIAGRMGLCGAPSYLIRGVLGDFMRLNCVVVEVLREALWEPLLPFDDTRSRPAEPEDAKAEEKAESVGKGSGSDEDKLWDADFPL